MKTSIVFRIIMIAFVLGVVSITSVWAKGLSILKQDKSNKPPEIIQGGVWSDDFWIGQLQQAENIDIQVSHLFLKYKEQLHWKQTWTQHFSDGEFFQTEAISDSVRLAWNDIEQNYFTTGIYTSTVYSPGKSVDWSTSMWRYSGIPDGVIIEFRTGDTPNPDGTWTSWQIPERRFMEYYCAYTFNNDETECFNNMKGIESSSYIQYRGSFESIDPESTVALYEIDFVYGIHNLVGSATSILILPIDLREWESVIITSTIPTSTTLIIDILAPEGTTLLRDVRNGSSLKGIDPNIYPAIQLRVNFTTMDESITPDIDVWGLRWSIWNRLYLPVMLR